VQGVKKVGQALGIVDTPPGETKPAITDAFNGNAANKLWDGLKNIPIIGPVLAFIGELFTAIAALWEKYVTPLFSATTKGNTVVQGNTQRLSALTGANADPSQIAAAKPTAEVVSHNGGETNVAQLDLERQRRLQPGYAPQQQMAVG
jgi:hypothetical protein